MLMGYSFIGSKAHLSDFLTMEAVRLIGRTPLFFELHDITFSKRNDDKEEVKAKELSRLNHSLPQ